MWIQVFPRMPALTLVTWPLKLPFVPSSATPQGLPAMVGSLPNSGLSVGACAGASPFVAALSLLSLRG